MQDVEQDKAAELLEILHRSMWYGYDRIAFNNKLYFIGKYNKSGVKYCRIPAKEGYPFELIQQNPNKSSHAAQLVRNGHKISWLVRRRGNNLMTYIGIGVVDGIFTKDIHKTINSIRR